MPALIAKKRGGNSLSHQEWEAVIHAYLSGEVPDYQISALLMAIYFQGMSQAEIDDLCAVMAASGDQLDLSAVAGIKVDKHSTGGVGDKTSLVVLPLAAAMGVKIAKLSGRGLGHTGGTLDKLEAIPGFSSDLSEAAFLEQANSLGLVLAGQTANLVPADKKLYALRDVTATVDSIPLIATSVMSKKLASGADAIVLDVKCGSGAFMKTPEAASELARVLVHIGRAANKPSSVFVSSMDRPLGRAVGNALEVNEAVATLRNQGPEDFTKLCIEIAAEMYRLSKPESITESEARARSRDCLESGEGLAYFIRWIEAQGGDSSFVHTAEGLSRAAHREAYVAPRSGYLKFRDVEAVGLASMYLGAGRLSLDQSIDLAAGLYFERLAAEPVEEGETIAWLYSSRPDRFEETRALLDRGLEITAEPPVLDPIILDVIRAD